MSPILSRAINILKAASLLAVVLLHSIPFPPGSHSYTLATFPIIGSLRSLVDVAVPFFFILSGYLFFRSPRFRMKQIPGKWRSRVFSLLIPYILWCLIYSIVRVIKVVYLGYPSYGLMIDGHFSIIGFLKGFWNTGNSFPVAFQLWFIRNLMVLTLLTPLISLTCRNWYVPLILICLTFCDIVTYNVEFYVFGAALALNGVHAPHIRGRWLLAALLLWLPAYILYSGYLNLSNSWLICLGFCIIMLLTLRIIPRILRLSEFINGNSSAFFFIYAVHGLYCYLFTKYFSAVVGCVTTPTALLSTLLSFCCTLLLSVIFFVTLRKLSPRLLHILSGRR